MSTKYFPKETPTYYRSQPLGWLERGARKAVLSRLAGLRQGQLVVKEKDQIHTFGRRSRHFPLRATVTVHDPRFYRELAFGGSIGAGEAYMQGYWSCNDLTNAVRILLRNQAVLEGMETGLAWLSAPLHKLFHWVHRNTQKGSRRNIAAHYDLGNALFALFLDKTLMYSCAVFEHPQMSLEQASMAKLDRICKKLALTPQDHLLEIGTGWGSLALHAARHYGCRVTTTTISEQQYQLACQRVREAGLEDRIRVLQQDYRDLTGQYDKLVSIEMIEAVGQAYFDAYFQKCSQLLKPEGLMLLQAITIADQRFAEFSRSVDFIQRYIFPGSCIPSVAVMTNSVARVTDMRLFHLEEIGPHYATTLRYWRENFLANLAQVQALGYSETFIRMWEFYLCYCEGGFLERATGDVQMLLTKPLCRQAPILPSLAPPAERAA